MFQAQLPLLPLVLDDVPGGLRRALAQEGVPFCDRREGSLDGRFVLFDSRFGPCRPPSAGQTLIDIDQLRHGASEDPFAALLDRRAARHEWQIDGLTLTEEIARVDKRALRREVLDKLRRIIEQHGGTWLRLSAFPFPYRSAFGLRVDHDRYDPRDFDTLFETIAGNEQATSHFVCGSAFRTAGEAYARLRGLDVGSHGYRHHTYRTEAENLRNIRRGIETLRAAGIEPSGFAAPHGRFPHGLISVLSTLGVTHSSEFALAYDEWPFLPTAADVLQIPIHPVCLGIFLEAAGGNSTGTNEAVKAAISYFRQTAENRYRSGEPVFFYGHPTGRLGRHPDVLRAIFDTVDQFGAIWKTTFTEFARWWRTRSEVRLTVSRQDEQFIVSVDRPADGYRGYRVGVEYWRGRHVALMPLDQPVIRFSPDALGYENRTRRSTVRPVRIDGPEGLKTHIRRMIDWERVTPLEEIGTGWRNTAKRALRRWWGE